MTQQSAQTGTVNQRTAEGSVEDQFEIDLIPMLLSYWEAVVRRKWIVLSAVAVALAIGVAVTMLQPKLYTARSQVEISRVTKNVTNIEGLEQDAGSYEREFYDTQYALLKAESLALRVVRSLGLANQDAFWVAHGIKPEDLDQANQPGAAKRINREADAVKILLRSVNIEPIRNSSLVNIKYTSQSPAMSQKIADAWPREFMVANMDRRLSATAEARKTLEDRLAGLKQRLEESEQRLIQFGNEKGIVILSSERQADGRTTENKSLATANLEALNQALVNARTERIDAESELKAARAGNTERSFQTPALQALRAKRAEVAADYAKANVRFGPTYPQVAELRAQLDALDGAIRQEVTRELNSRASIYDAALRKEKSLEAEVAQQNNVYLQQQRDRVQFNIFQREADTNRELYDALLQRYKEIGVAGTVDPSNVVIVDDAKLPETPSSPNMVLNIFVALIAGVGGGFFLVFVLEQLDDAIRSPADIENRLGLPILGIAPLTDNVPLEDLKDPKSSLTDAYLSLRASLDLSTTHGFPRSLLITSSQPDEGKSTSAFALAGILAKAGKRTLLIDADMRSPSLHKIFELPNKRGLSNLLAGDDLIDEAVVRLVGQEADYMFAGPIPPNAAELLSGERFAQLLGQLTDKYDHIIFDAPPMLGFADVPLVARTVEGVTFVIEVEKTSLRTAANAIKRLRASSATILGALPTKIDLSKSGYGYGYGYYYNYAYRYRYGERPNLGAEGQVAS